MYFSHFYIFQSCCDLDIVVSKIPLSKIFMKYDIDAEKCIPVNATCLKCFISLCMRKSATSLLLV